jgi:hypothetical protein
LQVQGEEPFERGERTQVGAVVEVDGHADTRGDRSPAARTGPLDPAGTTRCPARD